MTSDIWNINLKDLAGSLVSAVIMAVLSYAASLTNIYEIDAKQVLSIAITTAIVSLLKSLGTNKDGKFIGKLQVK